MVVNKRKKFSRHRGKSSHGYGAKKKHRGYGSKGGKGKAGSGKRAHQKKPTILKLYGPEYFGKHGFKRPRFHNKKTKTINLKQIEENLDKFATKEHDIFVVDLKKLGYDKVLSEGHITKKLKIMAKSFSKNAIEKIKEAGGEAVIC